MVWLCNTTRGPIYELYLFWFTIDHLYISDLILKLCFFSDVLYDLLNADNFMQSSTKITCIFLILVRPIATCDFFQFAIKSSFNFSEGWNISKFSEYYTCVLCPPAWNRNHFIYQKGNISNKKSIILESKPECANDLLSVIISNVFYKCGQF